MFVVLTVCLVLGHTGRLLTGAALVFYELGTHAGNPSCPSVRGYPTPTSCSRWRPARHSWKFNLRPVASGVSVPLPVGVSSAEG